MHNWEVREVTRNPLSLDALDINIEEERRQFMDAKASFSTGKASAFNLVTSTIDNRRRRNSFFLQGPAGTGKTFLYKTLCNYYRSLGKIVLCAASSGIASLLLTNGRTSHSLFKIPINSNEDSQCRVSGNSDLANLLRKTHLIIWDEVTLQNKYDFEAVNKLFKELMVNNDLFGGVPVVLGGDFAQILPVVRRGSREQVVNACIQYWSKWDLIQPLFLTQNMRVIEGVANQRFAKWLSDLPYNSNLYGAIEVPEWITTTDNPDEFREFVYPRTQLLSGDTRIFTCRAILSPRNDTVHSTNEEILKLRNAEAHDYFARDQVTNDEAGHISDYTSEFLMTLSGQGLPLGRLRLQVGMPVMLLRNLYPKKGLCNGTRLIITRLFHHGVEGRIISPDSRYNGELHYIHRMPVTLMKTFLLR